MDIKKILLISLIVLAIVASVSAVNAGTSNNNTTSDDINIILIKEYTYGEHYFWEDGMENTEYFIYGVFKGLPNNMTGYDLRASIYDNDGKLIRTEVWSDRWSELLDSSKKSEPVWLSDIGVNGFKEVSYYELKIYNPDGKVVFDKNVTYDMGTINTYDFYKHDDTSSNSGSSSGSKSEPFESEQEKSYWSDYYYDKYLADNG